MRGRGLTPRTHPPQLLDDDLSVVGIDECQFFGEELLPVVESLANRGLRVICAGLDQDYLGRPFDPMPHLMAVAEYVTKKLAVCMVCGNPANRSQRLTASESRVVIGADDAYEARCRRCFHRARRATSPPCPMTSPPPGWRPSRSAMSTASSHPEIEHRYGEGRPHPGRPLPDHPARPALCAATTQPLFNALIRRSTPASSGP
ncbi:MAG: hypothetical protein R3F43_06155 [bacterium]